MLLYSDVLDTPEYLWYDDRYENSYQQMKEYLDFNVRIQVRRNLARMCRRMCRRTERVERLINVMARFAHRLRICTLACKFWMISFSS